MRCAGVELSNPAFVRVLEEAAASSDGTDERTARFTVTEQDHHDR